MDLRIFLSKFIPHVCGVITISYTPFATIDPTNPIKMALLGTFAIALVLILILIKPVQFHFRNFGIYLLLGLIINLFIVFFVSEENKIEQFYGTIGRNFGLLTQISLIIFCATAIIYYSSNLVLNFKKSILIYGSINMIYGILQVMGEDFVKGWDTTYVNSARGFFANPNQNSSFTAMIALISMSNLLNNKRKFSEKLGTISFVSFALLNIYFSKSTQGFVVLGIGILILLALYAKYNFKNLYYLIATFVGVSAIAIFAVLDIFQKVPWKPILYSSTIETRGDYWRAGIAMGEKHPFFGVGLDKYLEWYRISRDDIAAGRSYASEVSNSSHNIFIDYFAWGGYPLLIIFILLQIIVVVKLFQIIRQNNVYNSELNTILIVYVAYLLQSMVSPVHIGFSIWGWVVIGLILGWKLNINNSVQKSAFIDKNKFESKVLFPAKEKKLVILLLFFGVLIGSLISFPYTIQEVRYREKVYGDTTVTNIYSASYIWPKSATRMAQASWKLYASGEREKSLEIALDAIRYSPNNYYGWIVLYSRSDLDLNLKTEVLKNITRLEPRVTNIKIIE